MLRAFCCADTAKALMAATKAYAKRISKAAGRSEGLDGKEAQGLQAIDRNGDSVEMGLYKRDG